MWCRYESGSSALVGRVEVGEEQADGDSLRAELAQGIAQSGEGGGRERDEHATVGRDALAQAETARGRHERWWFLDKEVVELGTGLASDYEHIFETFGGDQRHATAKEVGLEY